MVTLRFVDTDADYNMVVYLSMAMDMVDVLADQLGDLQGKQCNCSKCAYYCSKEWFAEQSFGMKRKALSPKSFFFLVKVASHSPCSTSYSVAMEIPTRDVICNYW